MVLDYPREVVERYLYERDGYWPKILSPTERTAMADYIRKMSFALAWELFSDEDIDVLPEESRKPISLQTLLEYCSGIFRRLSRIIAVIDRSPNQRVTRERNFVDFSLSRKAGPGSINWLMSHPRSHRFERPAPNNNIAPHLQQALSQKPPGGEEITYLPSEISETRVQLDYNTYENRFIRLFLTTMSRDMNIIVNLAEIQEEEDVRVKAQTLMRGISELLEYDFLKYSSPVRNVRRPSAGSYRQPQYQQAYELYRNYRRIFNFDWGNPLFKLPLRRTWLLYEYWCFFKMIETLMNLGFRIVKDRVTLFFEDPESKLTMDLPKGQSSVLELLRESDDALVTMLYSGESPDETFLNPAEGVYHPIAPSMFLMFEGQAYVFDVKFKKYTVDSNWHDDLDRLHGYRDALARIHRRTSLGTALEEASGCSSESGIMVLEQKPARKQGAPNRCCHRTNPTVSASSLTTIAWWPMPACSCRPP